MTRAGRECSEDGFVGRDRRDRPQARNPRRDLLCLIQATPTPLLGVVLSVEQNRSQHQPSSTRLPVRNACGDKKRRCDRFSFVVPHDQSGIGPEGERRSYPASNSGA
jgi:hypothetical protein